MVLDIESFREQEDPDAVGPEAVRENQRKRNKDVEVVDKIMASDAAWREARKKMDQYNKVKNDASRTFGKKKKAKEADGEDAEFSAELTEALENDPGAITSAMLEALSIKQLGRFSKVVDAAKQGTNEKMEAFEAERNEHLKAVGNMLHPSVPIHSDEDFNEIVRTIGDAATNKTSCRKKYSHVDLIEMIDGVDLPRGTTAAGGRCYYLKGAAVALENALVSFAMQFLMDREFTPLSPPLFMRKEVMQEVAQLSQFDDELYKVTGKASELADDARVEEKYLIATAEQPIAAFHRGEWIEVEKCPIRYVGISECFRQEVGSHGRDTLGIFRVHQFKKIEQFVICSPHNNESWKLMDEMLANAEDFLKAIGLPYQVINIVSGALNLAAAKKNDVEAWFPGSGAFRELVSCSNCTDYQSRRLQIRYGQTKKLNAKAEYVHMLNSTLCATTRVICCILENFQVGDFESKGGIVVPEALRPFMPKQIREFIPFVAPAPADVAAAKASEKAAGKSKGKSKGKGKAQ